MNYPHHKQVFFNFPIVARTTISNKKNGVIIQEVVLPRDDEADESDKKLEGDEDEGGKEGQDVQHPVDPTWSNHNPISLTFTHYDMGVFIRYPQAI